MEETTTVGGAVTLTIGVKIARWSGARRQVVEGVSTTSPTGKATRTLSSSTAWSTSPRPSGAPGNSLEDLAAPKGCSGKFYF